MKTVCPINACNACGACSEICPKKCIRLTQDYFVSNAYIDISKCISCKKCESVCPKLSIKDFSSPVEWLQGWADEPIRRKSASGGIASAIMYSFIRNGGYVAACRFLNGNFTFELSNNAESIRYFSGSKYVKSNAQNVYEVVKKTLKNAPVLFIGLPCQVAAVKNYCSNHENLYTVDLICHGTPSHKLLEKYLREQHYDLYSISDIIFRSKGLDDCKYKKIAKSVDEYMLAFLYGASYTDNCYNCSFANLSRISDVTLGDSWGSNYTEEIKHGISLILIQNPKGKKLISDTGIDYKLVDSTVAIEHNQQLNHPVLKTKEHERFVNAIEGNKSFSAATFKSISKAVIIQKIKTIKNTVLCRKDSNHFGIRILP